MQYANKEDRGLLTPKTLSDAIRHHLYDNVLYATEYAPGHKVKQERILVDERYPAKV